MRNVHINCRYAVMTIKFGTFYSNFITANQSGLCRHRLENYFYPDDFRNFLIPKIDLKHQKTFVVLVDQILATKAANPKADTSALEREIDNLVYRLYNLTCEEVKAIEPEFVMNRAEWEEIELEIYLGVLYEKYA